MIKKRDYIIICRNYLIFTLLLISVAVIKTGATGIILSTRRSYQYSWLPYFERNDKDCHILNSSLTDYGDTPGLSVIALPPSVSTNPYVSDISFDSSEFNASEHSNLFKKTGFHPINGPPYLYHKESEGDQPFKSKTTTSNTFSCSQNHQKHLSRYTNFSITSGAFSGIEPLCPFHFYEKRAQQSEPLDLITCTDNHLTYSATGTSRFYAAVYNPDIYKETPGHSYQEEPNNPTLISDTVLSICNEEPFYYMPHSNVDGTTFTWERKATTGIRNTAGAGTGEIDEVLVNTTNVIQEVIYNFTLTNNDLTTNQNIRVLVQPTLKLTSNLNPSSICSGTPFIYTATTSNPTATLSWFRPEVEGISNEQQSGSGAIINEILINTTSQTIYVPYTITMMVDECEYSQTIYATIRPVPQLEAIEDQELCAYDEVSAIVPLSSVPSTFIWTNNNPSIGLPATGTGPIPAFTASNNTDAPVTAMITITPRAGGCNGDPISFAITVNPVPEVTDIEPIQLCIGTEHPGITFNSPKEGSFNYIWSSSIDVGFGTSGQGNIPQFIGKKEGSAIVEVIAINERGCDGPPMNFSVSVNEPAVIDVSPANPQICLGGQTVLTASGAETYEWFPAEGLSATTGSQVIANPESTTTYTVTGIDNYGCTSIRQITVTVNPLPEIFVTPEIPVICEGGIVELKATGATSYIWEPAASLSASTGSAVIASPDSTTTYTVTGTNENGCISTKQVTVNVEAPPVLSSTLNPNGICSGSDFNYLPESKTAIRYQWSRQAIPSGSPANSGVGVIGIDPINEAIFMGAGETSTQEVIYFIELETTDGCSNTQEVRVLVSPQPQLTSQLPASICNGDLLSFHPDEALNTNITWSRSNITGISNPAVSDQNIPVNEILVNTTSEPVDVEYIFIMNQNGCMQEVRQTVTVLPGPQVEASASVTGPVCAGQPFNLFSQSPIILPETTIFTEGFESNDSGWITKNYSKGSNSNKANWTIFTKYPSEGIDPGNEFYLTSSSSTDAHTILTSPAITKINKNAPNVLEFKHYFKKTTNDSAKVQVSANKVDWITAKTFTLTEGLNNNFKTESIDLYEVLPPEATTLYIRFLYEANEGGLWAIDDVVIKERVNPTITWSSVPEGFTSSLSNPIDVTQTETTTYYVRYDFPEENEFTCDGVASVTVESVEDNEPPVLLNIPEDVEFSCVDCIQEFLNGSFEDPPPGTGGQMAGGGTGWVYWHQDKVPGWQTKSDDNRIEFHPSDFDNMESRDGNQHAELNAEVNSDLFQEFCTVPTTTLHIKFSHAKRNKTNNRTPDIMKVLIGDPGKDESTYFSQEFTATESGKWYDHTIVYPVAPGQTKTSFIFRAIQGSDGGGLVEGNLIDNISVVTLYNSDILPTATDNCDPAPVVTLQEEKIDGECSSNYELIRTWTATDAAGNKTSATQTVIVGDFEPPVLTITPNNETFECGTEVGSEIEINDNCAVPEDITVTFLKADTVQGDCSGKYTVIRSWAAADLCNNVDTFYQHIYFVDTTPPVFDYTPADADLTCTEASDDWPIASDNCTAEPEITFEDETIIGSCYGELTITRTWTATDDCGNSATHVQHITTHDETAPVWVTSDEALNMTLSCEDADGLQTAQALFPEAFDDCAPFEYLNINKHEGVFVPSASCPQSGTYNNVWTVSDDCGNTSEEFIQVITIIDNDAPEWQTKINDLDRTVECDDGAGLAAAQNLNPQAMDVCGSEVTVVKKSAGAFVPDNTCVGTGSYTNTWVALDACGNESSEFNQVIKVQDTKAPRWITPSGDLNVFVNCNDEEALAAAQNLAPTAVDNCDSSPTLVKQSGSFIEGSCPQAGTIMNTWTAIDACGNESAIYTQLIILEDYIPPMVECPQDLHINYGVDPTSDLTGEIIAFDECDDELDITFTDEIIDGLCVGNYEIRRNWVVADQCGNATFCTQSIFVQDIEAPAISCTAGNQIVDANNGTRYIHAGDGWNALAEDNTGSVSLTVRLSGATSSGPYNTLDGVSFNQGVTTVTWTAIDDCGNYSSCSYTVLVYAEADLEIKKSADKEVVIAGEELGYILEATNYGPATANNVIITDVITAYPEGQYALSPEGEWHQWEGSYIVPEVMPVGERITLYIRGVIPDDQCASVVNSASISSAKVDYNLSNNEASVTTPVKDIQPPVIDAPPTFETCVDRLYRAEYTDQGLQRSLYQNDNEQKAYLIDNENIEDYYLFAGGSPELDLDLEGLNYRDNCCDLTNGVEINWTIEFDMNTPNGLGGSTINGTGQPSEFNGDIKLWGDRINYVPLNHIIKYTVTDCNGNISEEIIRTIIIKPRPKIDLN